MNHITCLFLVASMAASWGAELPKRGRATLAAQDSSNTAQTSPTMSSPVLGLLVNDSSTMISTVMGVPGASTVGEPVALPAEVQRVWLAPTQTWAVMQLRDVPGLAVVPLRGVVARSVVPVGSSIATADLVAFSPLGLHAVAYSSDQERLQVITNGAVMADFETGALPAGPILRVAIDDSGANAIAITGEGAYLVTATSAPRLLYPCGTISDAVFFSGQSSLILADAGLNQVVVVDNPAALAVVRVIATKIGTGRMWIRPSYNNQWVFAVCVGSRTAHLIEMSTSNVQALDLPERPTRLDAVGGGGALAFSAHGRGPLWMLSADSGMMRVSFAARTGRNEEVGQ